MCQITEMDYCDRLGMYDSLNRRTRALSDAECWEWLGCKLQGYGVISITRNKITISAKSHRLAYAQEYGLKNLSELVVRHTCDNPSCVNPKHLLLGTFKDNSADRDDRGRAADFKGVKHGNARLTENDVRAILKSRTAPVEYLSNKYGVSKNHIGSILRGDRWGHIK